MNFSVIFYEKPHRDGEGEEAAITLGNGVL